MKELDFDELDRAVNSLMTNVKTDDPSGAQEKTVTLPSDSTTDASISAVSTTGQKESIPPASVTPAGNPPKTTLAPRHGKRFMDVVRPSPNTKRTETSATPVSRQGTTLAPMNNTPSHKEEPAKEVTAAPTLLLETTEHSAAKSEWPDPLDIANFKSAPEDKKPEATADPLVSKEKSEETPPLTSPFLPDTKVEKRPLGGVSPDEDMSLSPKDTGKENHAYGPNDQLPTFPAVEVEKPIPEELQGNLVAIESGHAAPLKTPSEALPEAEQPQEDDKPKTSKPSPSIEQKEEKTPIMVSKPQQNNAESEQPVPTGPVSIPQQYREEPSSGDQESGSIYDTDTYHQPLAHPTQKKSGWLWVVWILLILILGAAVGAGLFIFGII